MKTTITIDPTVAGIRITMRRGKLNQAIYFSQGTGPESTGEALRALAFDLLERAGGCEWNPDSGEVPAQIEKMLHENRPLFAVAGGEPT